MNLIARIARRIARPRQPIVPAAASSGSYSATIDLSHPSVTVDPFPHYERLRREGPVVFIPSCHAWVVLGYEETKAAFALPHIFSNAAYSPVDEVLLAADPPRHEAVRRIVARRFTTDMIAELTIVAEHLAPSLIAAETDVVLYATTLSRAVAAHLIGFDEATLDELVCELEGSLTTRDPLARLIVSLDRLAERSPLLLELIAAGEGAIGDAEARSLIRLLWLAATTTTERVISRAALRLAENSLLQEDIAADRSLLPVFIDEVLRLHPPELMVPRITREAFTLSGVDIPANVPVHLCVGAANRDPAVFQAPDEFRLDRPARRHFAFGSGIHHCVGAPLGRRLIASAVAALLDAGRLRLMEPAASLPAYTSRTAQAPTRIPLAIEPR